MWISNDDYLMMERIMSRTGNQNLIILMLPVICYLYRNRHKFFTIVPSVIYVISDSDAKVS